MPPIAREISPPSEASLDPVNLPAEPTVRALTALTFEMRTPLADLTAAADLLLRLPLDAEARACAEVAAEAGRRAARALADALELSSAQTLSLAPAPLRLMDLVATLERAWRPMASGAGVRLVCGYHGPADVHAVVDGGRLRRVLDAVMLAALNRSSLSRSTPSGSCQAASSGGLVELDLTASPQSDGLRLDVVVRDTGPTISSSAADQIFKPFGGCGMAETAPGAGVGLALAARLAHSLGGLLRLEPIAGSGAVWRVELLTAHGSVEASSPTSPAPPAGASADLAAHVLVVDDNATNRLAAQTLCRAFGCTSEIACDGEEAVALAASGAFDLILMDIRMPKLDGLQATRMIQRLAGPAAETPILALTAGTEPAELRACIEAGMAGVVTKPIQPALMLQAMHAAMEGVRTSAAVDVDADRPFPARRLAS